MIFLPDQPIFIRDEYGQRCSYDIRECTDALAAAFQKGGVDDPWLLEQFAIQLEEKLRNDSREGAPMSREEIDALLQSVLLASGYSDVASAYATERGGNPLQQRFNALAPWDIDRLTAVLGKNLPLSRAQLRPLVEQCRAALTQLRLPQASDGFIVDLAIHLAHAGDQKTTAALPQPPENTATDVSQIHIRTQEERMETLAESTREFIQDGILTGLPVATFFPRAQVAFSLANFCEKKTPSWASLLTIGNALPPAVSAALELLGQYRADIAAAYPNMTPQAPQVIFTRYKAFLDTMCKGLRKVERLAFDSALQELIQAHFQKQTSFELTLIYR